MIGDFAARLEAGKIEIGEYKKLRHRPGPGENQNAKNRNLFEGEEVKFSFALKKLKYQLRFL